MQNAMPNPFYINPEDDLAEDVDIEFNSEIFLLDPNAPFDHGNSKYEALMQKLIDSTEKELMLNFYVNQPVSKQWQKDGSMLVHVEYLRLTRRIKTAITSELDGVVDSVSRTEEGGYTVVVAGQAHSVPPGMDLQVTIGNTVEIGQLIAGSHTPQADSREY